MVTPAFWLTVSQNEILAPVLRHFPGSDSGICDGFDVTKVPLPDYTFSPIMGARMESTATIRHKRRVAVDRARLTWNRNTVLRRSSTGRLLLVLERCVALVIDENEMSSRRLLRLLDDLSYGCELADEAGVQNGWVSDGPETFSLVFALSRGDVVFGRLGENLGSDPFPREPIASSNSWVLSRAIIDILSQEKNSSPRRSTRIPTDVLVELQGEGFAYAGETITVNLHGALVRISAPLKVGDRVTLHVHHTGRSSLGAVVFADAGASQFGVELERPENIWGVSVPPADWKVVPLRS